MMTTSSCKPNSITSVCPFLLHGRYKAGRSRSYAYRYFNASTLRKDWKLKTTTTTVREESPTSTSEEGSAKFDWYKQWWPVQLMFNLKDDRPNRFELLERSYVAWKSQSGDWIVMKDECPHRLASLSEGRIEKDGTISCSYHGWRFNECGKCVSIPQAEDQKGHDTACKSQRSSVETFPCQIYGNMLWVWPEISENAFDNAKRTDVPLIKELAEILTQKSNAGVKKGFTRVMPYSWEILMENLIDPAHVPVTHHGLIPQLSRTKTTPLWMKPRKFILPSSIASVDYQANTTGGRRYIELLSPCSIFNGNADKDMEDWGGQLLLASPIQAGKSRLFFFNLPEGNKTSNLSWGLKIFDFIERYHPWLIHLGNHKFVDGDTVFLHNLDKSLRSKKAPWNPKDYFTPTSSDMMVSTFRKWLIEKGGNGPPLQRELINGQLPSASRRELLDRYYTHTIECESCQKAQAFIQKIISISNTLAIICLIYASRMWGKVSTLYNTQILFCIFLFCSLCFLSHSLKTTWLPQFEFVDYIHQEKN